MIIHKIHIDQFAGIRDLDMCFTGGLNVIRGDNETGKSTMISAMFHALTTDSKLDRRTDKLFFSDSFPANRANTIIDSDVLFSHKGAKYHVRKSWDYRNSRYETKLRTSLGDRYFNAEAEAELRRLLEYGAGVYDNIVFGRQDHSQAILDWCYRFFSDPGGAEVSATRKKISDVLSAAGGVSSETFLSIIDDETRKLSGHWDFGRDAPQYKKTGDRWVKGVGTILQAYYDLRDAQSALEGAESCERDGERLSAELTALRARRRELTDEKDALTKQRMGVDNITNLKKLIDNAERELASLREAGDTWRGLEARVAEGRALLVLDNERKRREARAELLSKIDAATELENEIKKYSAELAENTDIAGDYNDAQNLPTLISLNNQRLASGRLHADVRLEPNRDARLDLIDGTSVDISGGYSGDVSGYVDIKIPGVGEIQVSPQSLDVNAIKEQTARMTSKLQSILAKYGVTTVEELKALADRRRAAEVSLEYKSQYYKLTFGDNTPESLRSGLDGIAVDETITIPADLDERVKGFNVRSTLEGEVASAETVLERLKSQYGTAANVAERVEKLNASNDANLRQLALYGQTVTMDAAEYDRKMGDITKALAKLEGDIEDRISALGGIERQDYDIAELRLNVERREARLKREKRLFECYSKIRSDFMELRGEDGGRFDVFYQKFNDNLGVITDSRVSMEDQGLLEITTGGNSVSSGDLLSDGTKKTVLLAFRLAVLEYLFPDGDGLVALDDDLLDMDPGRRARAAALIRAYAQRNQVLFTTCDPSIADLLGGNRIDL